MKILTQQEGFSKYGKYTYNNVEELMMLWASGNVKGIEDICHQ